MAIRKRLLETVAGQLGHPHGVLGRLTGTALNRGNRATIAAAIDLLELRGGESVADLGFGGGAGLGLLLARLPAGRVVGVDRSQEMVAAAARRYRQAVADQRLRLEQGTLDRLPLPDHTLDAAITLNTFYFIADLDPVLAEIARILGGGGRLIVGLGDPAAMAEAPFTEYGFRLRPIEDVQRQLRAAGLTAHQDKRVGDGPHAYHLLLCTAATPSGPSAREMPAQKPDR